MNAYPSPSADLGKDPCVFFSPAKINLFFRVLYRRPDHYHEIASLYQAISLGDTLTLRLSAEDLLTSNDPKIPTDRSNLIYRSLDLFRKKTGIHFPVHFHIEKKIPIEAGLGGGSSNAATALWALNRLLSSPVSDEQLSQWISEFSSDGPFFFSRGTAYCSGRGEFLEDLEPPLATTLWIAKPKEGLSTPLVYSRCESHLFEKRDPRVSLVEILKGEPAYFNDLETPAFQVLPALANLKKKLFDFGFSHVVMTGSGTAFFCIGELTHQPFLPDVTFYPVSFHQRQSGSWYEFPSF
jgi:4-diphosphocytidyl-2-C-methyl-D-erythritol kinase